MDAFYIDIGGTYVRTARASKTGPVDIQKTRIQEYSGIEGIFDQSLTPDTTVMIASTGHQNTNGVWQITNGSGWTISSGNLEEIGQTAGATIKPVINDLEAACHALPALKDKDVEPLFIPDQTTSPLNRHKALVGVGTGLGLAYCFQKPGQGPVIHPTCGGHMVPAAITQEQFNICQKIRTYTSKPAIFENVVSGQGLLYLYQAVTDKVCLRPEQTLDNDVVARLFHEFLGLFIHQAVLYGDSFGGVYLTGGVIDALAEDNRLDMQRILEFANLPAVDLVSAGFDAVPYYRIRDPYITLQGLHEKFISDH